MAFTSKTGTSDSLLGHIILGASDSGTSSSSGNTQQISAADSGSAVDLAAILAATILVSETGVAADAAIATPSGATLFTGAESVAGVDAVTVTVGLQAADIANGTDSATVTDVTPFCDATSGSLLAATQRLGPEYFLPHWTTANSNRTGLLFSLCQWGAELELQNKLQASRAAAGRYLLTATTLEPLYEWTVNYLPASDQELTIQFQGTTVSGSVQRTARRATSQFDYDTAVDPVWYQDTNDRIIRLRNLYMRTIQRSTSGTVYTICGTDAAASFGVVPDSGYFYRRSPQNIWEWISPESNRFGLNSVSLPASGAWQITFGSMADLVTLRASGTVTITYYGGTTRQLPLRFTPVSNLFDGYGSLLGIPRLLIPLESNLTYKGRMVISGLAPPDPTLQGVIRGVASRFGLVRRVLWDGVNSLSLDPSSTQRITTVNVVGVARLFEMNETLYATSGNTIFYTQFSNWREGALILVNGIPVNTYSVSGNRITFARPVTGSVAAIYSVNTFSTVLDNNGYVTTLNPGQGLASGSYNVVYTSSVNAHVVDQPDYQTASLLTSSGLPNSLFTEIATRLTENNPTAFGRARWGGNTTWLELTDQQPKISRLPVPFDNNN